jgi:Mn2+/Fe2+ NRAMP family transporter
MLRLVNNVNLMHEWINPRFYNVVAWIAVCVLIAMTVVLVGSSVRGMFVSATSVASSQ